MWKKVKMGGKVPHLSRWFDHISNLPECKAAVEELDVNSKKKGTAAAEGSMDAKKGGGGELSPGKGGW